MQKSLVFLNISWIGKYEQKPNKSQSTPSASSSLRSMSYDIAGRVQLGKLTPHTVAGETLKSVTFELNSLER